MLLKRYQNMHNPPETISTNVEAVDDIIAPYTVESTGAQVTLTTAISLVNRFLFSFTLIKTFEFCETTLHQILQIKSFEVKMPF